MTTELKVFERVRNTIVKIGHGETGSIEPESKLDRDLEMDSLDIVELELALEEEFNRDMTDVLDPIDATDTVGDVVRLVEERVTNG